MADLQLFYGASIEYDNTQSQFRGLSIEFQENLILRFFDSFGNLIDSLDELEINDGTTVTTLTNIEGGSYSLYVEDPTVFIVKATDDGKEGFASFFHEGGDFNLVQEIHLLTPPCREDSSDNLFNFFHFHRINNIKVDEIPTTLNSCGISDGDYLPNAYQLNCREYVPTVLEGEELQVQINLNEPNTDSSGGYVLSILRGTDIVLDSIAPIQKITSGSGEIFSFSWTPEKGMIPLKDDYKFMVYDQSNGDVIFISNKFSLNSSAPRGTVYLQYRNSSNLYNYIYELDTSFYNKVRVHLNMINSQGEYSLQQQPEATTGEVISLKGTSKKVITLEAYFFDEYAHDAMRCLSLHDNIIINGKEMKVKEGYEANTNIKSGTSKGTMEFYEQSFGRVNYNI